MEFNKNYITTYYTDIKNVKNYPEAFLYELFLIGKISRDNDLVAEISETLKEYGTIQINNAFKMRNKLPENGQDATRIIKSFLQYGTKDPLFPIGKLYTMMDFAIFSIDEESIAKKLEKQPDLILRLQGITELHIEGVFNKDIPEEFCYISSLKTLEIKGDYKNLPTSMGNLQQLENLTLNLANLESFPSSFWNLKALKELDLKNIVTDCQRFFQLNKLKKLVKIYLLNVNLKDTSLLKLPTSLTEISFIRLDNISKLPNSIATLKNLEKLNVYKCPRLKELPEGLEHLDNLSVMSFEEVPLIKEIKDNQIFTVNCSYISLDDDIKVISNGAPLFNSELLIRDAKLLNYVLTNPKNFCSLKSLQIHYINDFSEVTEGLGQLKNLESIDIHQGSNTNILWQNIDKCTNLKYLKLYNVNIETFPDGLKNLKNIEYLNFRTCRNLTLNGNNLPAKLKELHISEIEEFIPGKHILEIDEANFGNLKLQNPKELFSTLITKKLHVVFLNQGAQGLEDLTQYLPKPEALIELKAYTNTCNFKRILKHCTQLKRLHLENKEENSSPVYAYPAPQLEYLRLHFYKAENLEDLLSNMPNLETIDLAHYDISETFPEVSLPRLKVLNLSYTSFETLETLNAPMLNTLRIELSYKFGMEGYSKLNQFKKLKKLSFIGISHDVKTVPKSITELKLTEFLIGHKIDILPEYLKRITTLETLSLGGNDFINIPNWISALPRLTRLDIDGCQFENAVPESFRRLKLKELKYYIGKFNGGNMPAEKYKYLITPGYTKLRKAFSTQDAD
ncbi:leucine-rich repeat domain-containing protein [Formosa sp. L2A11]|uniref:leucine-rich repeat domain-containing protein n=1 Tax=Formosa sp. L2A11 TaxID=2686363 RepID=UPI00131DF926|nr:hypothetical protein [Formosa sp. L2A11]